MLFDMMKDAEQKAGAAALPPEPRRLEEADKEVLQQLKERLRHQILTEMAAEKAEAAGGGGNVTADAVAVTGSVDPAGEGPNDG
jgi:hypothetical protein